MSLYMVGLVRMFSKGFIFLHNPIDFTIFCFNTKPQRDFKSFKKYILFQSIIFCSRKDECSNGEMKGDDRPKSSNEKYQ